MTSALNLFCGIALCVVISASLLLAEENVIIYAKVRDFQMSGAEKHPDFQTYESCDGKGAISPKLKLTDATSSMDADNRGPEFVSGSCVSSAASFDQWFNDKETNINRPFVVDLDFNADRDAEGFYSFGSNSFFPLDALTSAASLTVPPVEPFGKEGESHNYGFTTEFHMKFTYKANGGQEFRVNGDDDVFVFVNDSLVIDMGGTHSATEASVSLDQLPTGFLTDGQEYFIDFFHAERHTTKSNLFIETNCIVVPYGPRPRPSNSTINPVAFGRHSLLRLGRDKGAISFVAPSDGQMRFYQLNGKAVGAVAGRAGQRCQFTAVHESSPLVYEWHGENARFSGLLTSTR
jgi:fibro-slime domain-containing protein